MSGADSKLMDRLVAKAAWLIHEGRIVKISDIMYYVVGRKNRHLVKVEGGRLVCSCNGFKERGICSHTIAVSTVIKLSAGREYLNEALRERMERELKLLSARAGRIR